MKWIATQEEVKRFINEGLEKIDSFLKKYPDVNNEESFMMGIGMENIRDVNGISVHIVVKRLSDKTVETYFQVVRNPEFFDLNPNWMKGTEYWKDDEPMFITKDTTEKDIESFIAEAFR